MNLKDIYGKELNTKKNILDSIQVIKSKKDELTEEEMQELYTEVYNSIENMITIVKTNTIMYLKNNLKKELSKYVKDIDPKKENTFIEFFKGAYPNNKRKKDFTWVLMDINRITEEQIWETLTYINRICLKGERINSEQKKDTLDMISKLLKSKDMKYINGIKSLEKLTDVLKIKIIPNRDSGYKYRPL